MSKIQVDEIVNSTGTGSPSFTFGAPGDTSVPLRLYATTPVNSALNIAPYETTDSFGAGKAAPPQLNAVNTTQMTSVTTIDFQTGTVSPIANVSITFPSSTSGDYRRIGFSYSASTGTVTATFSAASATFGGLANVGSLFVANQRPIGWLDLQSTGGTGYKTAGSTMPYIENSVSGTVRVHNFSPASSTLALQGTANQVIVSQTGAVATLSTPQSIGTASTPTFGGLTVTGNSNLGNSALSSNNLYGNQQLVTIQTTGNIVRNNLSTFTDFAYIRAYVDSFTDLSTTAWSLRSPQGTGIGILHFYLTTVDNRTATFTIYGGNDSISSYKYGVATGASGNCTVSEGAEGVFSVSGIGDGRTYTITCSASNGSITITASTLATGTTTVKIIKFF